MAQFIRYLRLTGRKNRAVKFLLSRVRHRILNPLATPLPLEALPPRGDGPALSLAWVAGEPGCGALDRLSLFDRLVVYTKYHHGRRAPAILGMSERSFERTVAKIRRKVEHD